MMRVLSSIAALALVACGGDPTPPDGGSPADGGREDAGRPLECGFPLPLVAGTPATDAVAEAPARCGQPPYAWLRDPALGTRVEVGSVRSFSVRVLQGLAEAAGSALPREPSDAVELKTYRYLTQDRGELVETTATLAYPSERSPGDPLDVVLFLHGTSGFKEGCGPSSDASGLLAALIASYGYVVVMPDYLGLEWGEASYGELHPYLVGEATAIASIDAVRAAGRMAPGERAGVCARPRVITVGGSEGGIAALWVDRLMPYYARELEHAGVVATVPPADLLGEVERALQSLVDASANTAAFYATAPFWYGAGGRLGEVFQPPYDVDLPAALRAECSPGGLDGVTALSEVFTPTMLDAAAAGTLGELDPFGCMVRENGLTTTSIPRLGGEAGTYGILYVTGEADTLVTTPIQREAYRALCEAGVPLTYLECEGASHTQTTLWAFPELLAFVDARAAGEPFTPGPCAPSPPTRCAGTPAM